MLCHCCSKLLKQVFENRDIRVLAIKPGFVELEYDETQISVDEINLLIQAQGMEVIKSKEEKIVEKIKRSVIELIHESNNINSILRKSDYLVEKLAMSYQQMSKIFSKYEQITLERYIILHKIERIKELIDTDEFTLSEIAYMMDYSSVQYLSNQFKKETGMTVSEYKKKRIKNKIALDELTKKKISL